MKGKIQIFEFWSKEVGNMNIVTKFLVDLVQRIGMTPHGYPQVIPYPKENLGNTVISSFVAYQPLYESYVVFDNWVDLNYANLVVNSCKDYDSSIVEQTIIEYFACEEVRSLEPVFYTGEKEA
jgi:hypothetical protein